MSTRVEFMILFGDENRPPTLKKHLYDSWKSIMELYMQNREHARMIFESVEHGPLIWPTIKENVHQDAYPQPQSIPQIEYTVSKVNQQTHLAEFPQIDSGLAVLVFKQRDDPIDAINKMMSFLSNVVTSRHITRQCPKPKRKRDATWFRDKVLLVEAQGSGKVLNKEELEFLADLGVTEAKEILMANLSSYGSVVLSKVPHFKNTHNDMLNQSVQEMSYSEQTHLVNYLENEILSICFETQNAVVRDTNSSAQQDAMILYVFEQLSNQVTNCNKVNKDNLIANKSLSAELERYKEQKDQEIWPMLYDGSGIPKDTNVISIVDSEETLMHEEESRSKMILKQSDPMVLEKKANIKPINYAELNRLSKDF
nr:hypothetical protein [Tanacetum cinerariifolium]